MSGSRLGTPKSQDGWVDGVRCMLAARSGAVKARTSAINTARSLLTTAPEGLRSRFRGMGGPRLMEELPVSVNIIFTISTNAFSPIAPTRIHRIRQRGCAAFGA